MEKLTTIVIATYPGDKYKDKIVDILRNLKGYKKEFDILVIGFSEKRSFSVNNNIGAKKAKTKYVLFLNSDTEPQGGFVKEMEHILNQNKQFGVVGAKLIFADDVNKEVSFRGQKIMVVAKKGTVQHAGIQFNDNLVPFEFGRGADPSDEKVNTKCLVGGVTGACMMVRREEFLNLGGFDEEYKNGWEDSDLCLRYLENKKLSFYQPDAIVFHHFAGSSNNGRFDFEDDNFKYWMEKWLNSGRIHSLFPHVTRLKLDVGCGGNKKEGYYGIDKFAGSDVDLVFDLNVLEKRNSQIPFDDSSVDEINCVNVLHYVESPINVLNEFYRILRLYGKLTLVVPYAGSWNSFADPLIKHYFVPETFRNYFASDSLEIKNKYDLETRFIKPWHVEKIEFTQTPVGTSALDITREITVTMRPLK